MHSRQFSPLIMQFKRLWAPLLLLVFAFAARFFWLDTIRFDHPNVRVHAGGIVILDAIAAGRFHDLPLLGQLSNINLVNPVGTSYFLALLSFFERNPFCSVALFAMLNVLGVAMVYDLGRRFFGKTAGLVSAALAASSPWAIITATGVSVQGLLEISAVACAWLIFVSIQQRNRRRLFVGFVVAAVLMQTYLMAMLLAVQVFFLVLYAWGVDRKLSKPAVLGFAVCVLSGLVFVVLLLVNDLNPITQLQSGLKNVATTPPSLPNPFGLHIDLAGFNHGLRIVTGLDFENEWTNPNATDFALRNTLSDIRAAVVGWAIWIGVIIAVIRLRANLGYRLTLTWFGVPAVLLTILLMLRPNVYPAYQYMLITAPAGYLLAGIPFGLLAQVWRVRAHKCAARKCAAPTRVLNLVANGVLSVALGAAMIVPVTNLAALADTLMKAPLDYGPDIGRLPLHWQLQLGDLLRAHCDRVDSSEELYWANVSLFEASDRVGNGTSDARNQSDVWRVSPQGGDCVVRLPGQPIPQNAEAYPLQVAPDTDVVSYRSKPIELFLRKGFTPLTVNLGWSLVDLETPATARPGEMITVTHVWRIDSLPTESHWFWYFAPFIDLARPDGAKVVSIDNAPAIIGWNWQPGSYIISTVRLNIPADATGDYHLKLSLFDPNQKINAVYFDPARPEQPIVVIDRLLTIVPR